MEFTMNFGLVIGAGAGVALLLVIKRLIRMGFRILFGILMIVVVYFAAPRVNAFLAEKISQYDFIEKKISAMVDEDIEKKVMRDYKTRTGEEITDEEFLEQLKAQEYSFDPNLPDDLNIMMNAGLPEGVENTLLLNFASMGHAQISADNFPDYVARYFVVRMTTLIAYIITFCIACRLFNFRKDPYDY